MSVAINEIRIDQSGTDNDEYFELFGTPGLSLTGLTYLVIGDGSGGGSGGSGVIETVFALSGTLNASGFLVAAGSGFTLGSSDLLLSANFFENGDNVTHLLVENFTGALGDDLDTNNDGTLDITPWSNIVDSVAFFRNAGSNQIYSATVVGPDGSNLPDHIFRNPDGAGAWQIGDFTLGADDTPGAANGGGGGPTARTIAEIQGAAHTSPLLGQVVATEGIVTAVAGNGFYLQDPVGDGNEATSEGIFVFTSSAPGVSVGDRVRAEGSVSEFTPGGASSGNLSITQISAAGTTILSSGNPLPAATVVGAGGRVAPTQTIDDDGLTSFNPANDGIDFYESLEGMRLQVNNAVAVSATSGFGEIAILPDDGASAGLRTPRGGIIVQPNDFNPERLVIDDGLAASPPAVKVGDRFNGPITGVLSYSFGDFKLLNTQPLPAVTPSGISPETTALAGTSDQLAIASFNVENLDANDPADKFAKLASQIVANLRAPDILGLQEIQDNNGQTDDGTVAADQTFQKLIAAIAAAGGPTYEYRQINPVNNADGGAPGSNIRVGYLFNPARVSFRDRGTASATEANAVNAGPSLALSPGRVDPNNPAFAQDGQPGFEASRKSLAAEFEFNGKTVFVINNHFKSKGGDTPLFGATQPPNQVTVAQRTAQAQAINDFVDSLLTADPNAKVVVLGDLNDFQFSTPVQTLAGGVLTNLVDTLPANERYSFNFGGNAQALDHILVSNSLAAGAEVDIVHVNSEFAAGDRASDHDPVVARLSIPDMTYTLQLLHAADQEAGVRALDDAPRFSAVLNALKDDFANTLILSSGDAYIPGIFLDASADPSLAPLLGKEGAGRGDIAIQNELGFQAISFGNHEFDKGPSFISSVIAPDGPYVGAKFPYLSANLDFAPEAALAGLVVADGQNPAAIPGKIAKSVVIDVNGEKIGVVGATTPTLKTISSTGNVGVSPAPFDANNPADLQALANQIQPAVDALIAANPGLNKVVLLAHMQQIAVEQNLAGYLKNVDIIVAGGSNTRLFDANDRIRAGDTSQGTYPIVKTDADGKPVAVVNTDGNYKYVGRLVIDFDGNGNIIPGSYNPNISGAYATDEAGVDLVYGTDVNPCNVADPEVVAITDALRNVIQTLDSNFFGVSNVYLNGNRAGSGTDGVRNQETNLGNLTADANLYIAKQADPTTVISLKNGGGIRASIGQIVTPTGAIEPVRLPPAGNELTGKPEGGISQPDIQSALAFNNGLSLVTVTATELKTLLEYGIEASTNDPQSSQGRFPQVGGMAFSFDLDNPAGQRIQTLAIKDDEGNNLDIVVTNGQIVGDPNRTFRMVTLGFLADGGDGYPFATLSNPNRVDLALATGDPRTGAAQFAPDGSEQDALAEYVAAKFSSTPFDKVDVPRELDTRIQNLNFRADTVLGKPDDDQGVAAIEKQTNNLFKLNGEAGTTLKLRLTLKQVGGGAVNEIGVLKVDDDQGSVDGQRSGSAGYVRAALARSRVLFSALPDTIFERFSSTRVVEYNAGDRLMFFLVQNGTVDQVLRGGGPGVLLANNGNALNARQIASGNFELRWEDGLGGADFGDVVLSLEYALNASLPIGTRWQGDNEREIIDLRDIGARTASITIRSEAAFANTVGLYAIDNPDGRIGSLMPGDPGYARAAAERLVTRFDRGGTAPVSLQGLLAPMIVTNATLEQFLEDNPDNALLNEGPVAYFPYIAANPDGVDHLRLFGDNLFGFEDLPGGGDLDYNDMVFQIAFG